MLCSRQALGLNGCEDPSSASVSPGRGHEVRPVVRGLSVPWGCLSHWGSVSGGAVRWYKGPGRWAVCPLRRWRSAPCSSELGGHRAPPGGLLPLADDPSGGTWLVPSGQRYLRVPLQSWDWGLQRRSSCARLRTASLYRESVLQTLTPLGVSQDCQTGPVRVSASLSHLCLGQETEAVARVTLWAGRARLLGPGWGHPTVQPPQGPRTAGWALGSALREVQEELDLGVAEQVDTQPQGWTWHLGQLARSWGSGCPPTEVSGLSSRPVPSSRIRCGWLVRWRSAWL